MFNRIEFWRIWRKEQKFAASILGSRKQPFFGMERSIIHYNHGTLFQRRQKLVRKPKFKKAAVHRPTILKRCKNLVRHLSGNNAAAFILSAADPPEHPLPPRRISVFPIQVCIYAAFVHIRNLFGRYVLDFFLICCCFLLVLFLVTSCLFFLLFYTDEAHLECRFRCIQMPRPFPIGMRQDAPTHMLSTFPDRSFEILGAALSSPNPPFLSAAFPSSVWSIWIP